MTPRLKESVRAGEVQGPLADFYLNLPDGERDEFLEGQIQAVHFTALGICVHDFAIDPCPYHLNCVRGCPEYLRTKGNQRERANLISIQERVVRALAMANEHAAAGNPATAEPWIRHNQETLAGIEAALAVDDDASTADGAAVRAFGRQAGGSQPPGGGTRVST